ncbi:MAG: hypothetical protein LBV60_05730, partial [Streptomyces sp.]|nr:hypothetical protein [Streptomyces sp.]
LLHSGLKPLSCRLAGTTWMTSASEEAEEARESAPPTSAAAALTAAPIAWLSRALCRLGLLTPGLDAAGG